MSIWDHPQFIYMTYVISKLTIKHIFVWYVTQTMRLLSVETLNVKDKYILTHYIIIYTRLPKHKMNIVSYAVKTVEN